MGALKTVAITHVVRLFVALLPASAVAACGSAKSDVADETARGASREVVVTRDNPALPAGCRPLAVGKLALRFSDALNAGDEAALAAIWGGRFEWFSATGPRVKGDVKHFVSYTPQGAPQFVQERHGFQMRLTELAVSGRGRGGGVDVSYGGVWVERIAGKKRRYSLIGKGFVNCEKRSEGGSIRVWSMAIKEESGLLLAECPSPAHRRDALVTCSRW